MSRTGNLPLARDALGFAEDASVIVTGAGHGIGWAIASVAFQIGLKVSAWDLDKDALLDLEASLGGAGGRLLAMEVDVNEDNAVASAVARTVDAFGSCGFLVNNAGPSSRAGHDFDDGLHQAVSGVRRVTERWMANPGGRNGSVVNMSSLAGALTGGGAVDWYATAKAAIAGYTLFLAQNRPNGIRANAIAPGLTRTRRTEAMIGSELGKLKIARCPMQREAEPVEIAYPTLMLLSPASSYVNGVILPVDGGSSIIF